MSSVPSYKALKGMQDLLPPDISLWQKVEAAARDIFNLYGFQEMRTPVAEPTQLFTRGIGEDTDIVEKEMYTFNDKGGRTISLRPEGTASVVRSYVEHHLYTNPAPQKYFYMGPMFRYERPQSGRFRQFYQIGVEAFGTAEPWIDAELLSMLRYFFSAIGLRDVSFQINSIGCEQCRPAYKQELKGFFKGQLEAFCPDCVRRYENNPLRLLDCKVQRCIELRTGAPRVTEYLCQSCSDHFTSLKDLLGLLGIPYSINPDMVRGLDYYTRTTFEVLGTNLGAQSAVAAGGRYDRLVQECGGPATPAIGFAVGMERIVMLLKQSAPVQPLSPTVFIAALGEAAGRESLVLAERLRLKGIGVEIGYPGASLKSHMRKADRLSAHYVLIMGDDELSSKKLRWKRLVDSSQGEIPVSEAENLFSTSP